MKFIQIILIGCLASLFLVACNKEENSPTQIEVTGILEKQGITTYQYGTHVMDGYAFRSSTVDLDVYVGQTVTAVGYVIEEEQAEKGPVYIEVEKIK